MPSLDVSTACGACVPCRSNYGRDADRRKKTGSRRRIVINEDLVAEDRMKTVMSGELHVWAQALTLHCLAGSLTLHIKLPGKKRRKL